MVMNKSVLTKDNLASVADVGDQSTLQQQLDSLADGGDAASDLLSHVGLRDPVYRESCIHLMV